MAKRKKQSKVQKRATLRRGKSAPRAKAAKATKRMVVKAKPKRPPAKKAVRKVKQPVAPVIETVAVEAIKQPAPDTLTEAGETEIRKAS